MEDDTVNTPEASNSSNQNSNEAQDPKQTAVKPSKTQNVPKPGKNNNSKTKPKNKENSQNSEANPELHDPNLVSELISPISGFFEVVKLIKEINEIISIKEVIHFLREIIAAFKMEGGIDKTYSIFDKLQTCIRAFPTHDG